MRGTFGCRASVWLEFASRLPNTLLQALLIHVYIPPVAIKLAYGDGTQVRIATCELRHGCHICKNLASSRLTLPLDGGRATVPSRIRSVRGLAYRADLLR